jgi:peptidoglycan/xylan/chitin deacetylase (PgdA/CDA1 family)
MNLNMLKHIFKADYYLASRRQSLRYSVYYHCVSNAQLPHLLYLYSHKNISQFEHDLDVLASTFEPVTLDQYIALPGSLCRRSKPPLLITFDDGLREVYDVAAPILLRKGIPATFFITKQFVDNKFLCYHHRASLIIGCIANNRSEDSVTKKHLLKRICDVAHLTHSELSQNILSASFTARRIIDEIANLLEMDFDGYLRSSAPYLSTEQLDSLVHQGFNLGGHGTDHSPYAGLTFESQIRQTEECLLYLKTRFNQKFAAFSFPHGAMGVSPNFFDAIKDLGIADLCFGTHGFRSQPSAFLNQRLGMEKPLWSAEKIILRHLMVCLSKRIVARHWQGSAKRSA